MSQHVVAQTMDHIFIGFPENNVLNVKKRICIFIANCTDILCIPIHFHYINMYVYAYVYLSSYFPLYVFGIYHTVVMKWVKQVLLMCEDVSIFPHTPDHAYARNPRGRKPSVL